MDQPRPVAHRPPFHRCRQSPVFTAASNRATRNSRAANKPPPQIRQRPPPISRLSRRLRTTKREGPPPVKALGPRHRIKSRRPDNPHPQNHTTLPDGTSRTLPVPQRAHRPWNHPAVEKSLCRVILLHQKEEWEAQTSPRLPTRERMDDQKPLPSPPYPLPHRPFTRLHEVHWGGHRMGIQRSPHQTRRPMEGSLHY